MDGKSEEEEGRKNKEMKKEWAVTKNVIKLWLRHVVHWQFGMRNRHNTELALSTQIAWRVQVRCCNFFQGGLVKLYFCFVPRSLL